MASFHEVSVKRLLLTGFQPFLGEKLNPSEKLIHEIEADPAFNSWVDTLLLPVTFAGATEDLFRNLQQSSYQFVLMLGQAGGRSKISLEKVALNWLETTHPDEAGVIPDPRPINSKLSEAIISDLPLREFEAQLKKMNIPVEVSFSAGTFVCNYIYFQAATHCRTTGQKCLFVHVPYLPEQVVNKPSTPSMEFSIMSQGLHQILNCIKTII